MPGRRLPPVPARRGTLAGTVPLPIPPSATGNDLLYRVAYLAAPGGSPIPFLIKSEQYRERFTNDTDGNPPGGSTATASVVVGGENVERFVQYFLGFTEPNTATAATTLVRRLPY